ncbi:MAG: hypothetical protein IKC03_09105 [Oscillospiraceae bacterium]|nr:hypothetical protein [Oscillospiraceae bacterium]
MLRLKNIKVGDKIAEADFIPEDSQECGHIVVDLERKEVIAITHVKGYEIMHPSHAKRQLLRMADAGDHRKECLVMWY